MTIEAIFFKIRNLLLEWSGQLIFLGSMPPFVTSPSVLPRPTSPKSSTRSRSYRSVAEPAIGASSIRDSKPACQRQRKMTSCTATRPMWGVTWTIIPAGERTRKENFSPCWHPCPERFCSPPGWVTNIEVTPGSKSRQDSLERPRRPVR
jgi:hypothetical protein